MDIVRFDRLTHTVSSLLSRRTLVGTLGLSALAQLGLIEAKRKRKRRKHKKHQRRCSRQCDDRKCGPDGCGGSCGACADDQSCLDGTCCTPASLPETCGGRCGMRTNTCGQAVNCGSCPTATCADHPCGDGGDSCATCTTTSDSYTCTCCTGFVFNGVTCTTGCGSSGGGDPCGMHGVCTATGGGSYSCTCNAGYVFNGATCLPL